MYILCPQLKKTIQLFGQTFGTFHCFQLRSLSLTDAPFLSANNGLYLSFFGSKPLLDKNSASERFSLHYFCVNPFSRPRDTRFILESIDKFANLHNFSRFMLNKF